MQVNETGAEAESAEHNQGFKATFPSSNQSEMEGGRERFCTLGSKQRILCSSQFEISRFWMAPGDVLTKDARLIVRPAAHLVQLVCASFVAEMRDTKQQKKRNFLPNPHLSGQPARPQQGNAVNWLYRWANPVHSSLSSAQNVTPYINHIDILTTHCLSFGCILWGFLATLGACSRTAVNSCSHFL